MRWIWPLAKAKPLLPDAPGSFGAVRTHDVHTGVDLYCELGQEVVTVEAGEVIRVEKFTGPLAEEPSPWWNDTDAILVRGASGVVTYGEVHSLVKVGDVVLAGQVIARVDAPVLKSNKGRPMVMLHLELQTAEAATTVWWRSDEPKPSTLMDPTPKLVDTRPFTGVQVFDLATYDGRKFIDPQAPRKASPYWKVWGEEQVP